MPMTAMLGVADARFGNIEFGLAETSSPVASSVFTISQSVGVLFRISLSATNTLVLEEVAEGRRNFTSILGSPLAMLANIELEAVQPGLTGAANVLTFAQSATLGHLSNLTATNTLAFVQVARGFTGTKIVSQSLVLTSTGVAKLVLLRSSTASLTFHQVSDVVQIRPASNVLSITELATCTVTKGAKSTLVITQTLDREYDHFDFPFNEFVITQIVNMSLSTSVSNTFTLSQLATAHRIKIAAASNLFVVTANGSAGRFAKTSNTLVFSQVAVGHKISTLSVVQSLNFGSSLSRNTIIVRSLIDNLIFQHTYQKPTQIGGIFTTTLIPELIWTKVKNRVIFRTKDRAIILLPPELGDAEGGTGKIVLQRTITGGTYTYARRTTTRMLKYIFNTDQFKALEMRRFMLDNLSEPIWLENWKGELWIGYFTNNPIEFKSTGRGAVAGDRYSFDIEFEGARIH